MTSMQFPPFEKFVKSPFRGRLLTIDPGETTGYSIWDNQALISWGQLPTGIVNQSISLLETFLEPFSNQPVGYVHAVVEEYRVYGHKTDDHAHSTMHTSRLIGALECLFTQRQIGYEMVGASLAKKFATDDKLKAWGLYGDDRTKTTMRHARDAIRHGVYFYCR